MKEHLTDLQILKIEQFVNDNEMYEAVRKVLLASIYTHGTIGEKGKETPNPLINGAFSLASLTTNNPIPDDVLGQQLKAMWAGVNALHNGLTALKTIKSGVETPYEEINEAM